MQRLLVLVFILLFGGGIAGCASNNNFNHSGSTGIVQLMDNYFEAETAIIDSVIKGTTTRKVQFLAGFADEIIKNHYELMPPHVQSGIADLQEIGANKNPDVELTPEEIGRVRGILARLVGEGTKQLLEIYAPRMLALIKLLFPIL